jgi:hypothetical protein
MNIKDLIHRLIESLVILAAIVAVIPPLGIEMTRQIFIVSAIFSLIIGFFTFKGEDLTPILIITKIKFSVFKYSLGGIMAISLIYIFFSGEHIYINSIIYILILIIVVFCVAMFILGWESKKESAQSETKGRSSYRVLRRPAIDYK